MKKLFAAILLVCVCFGLIACYRPSDKEVRDALTLQVMEAAMKKYPEISYCRVNITSLEEVEKNCWKAEGAVSHSLAQYSTVAITYTATIRFDPKTKTYSGDTVLGEVFEI